MAQSTKATAMGLISKHHGSIVRQSSLFSVTIAISEKVIMAVVRALGRCVRRRPEPPPPSGEHGHVCPPFHQRGDLGFRGERKGSPAWRGG